VFASGSPFDMVEVNGQKFFPGQGNNAYIFPGVAFGAILAGLHHVPDAIFLKASQVASQRTVYSILFCPNFEKLNYKKFKIISQI